MADEFPEEVRRFILEAITSVEQLEILLLLKSDPAKEWPADAVSQAVYTQTAAAAMRLEDLRARGLVAQTEGPNPARYRYRPGTPEKDRLVNAVAEAYRERRVAVIALIYSKPTDQVQAFADAFKLRKDK